MYQRLSKTIVSSTSTTPDARLYKIIWKLGTFRKHKTIYAYTNDQITVARDTAVKIIRTYGQSSLQSRLLGKGLVALFVKYYDKPFRLKPVKNKQSTQEDN